MATSGFGGFRIELGWTKLRRRPSRSLWGLNRYGGELPEVSACELGAPAKKIGRSSAPSAYWRSSIMAFCSDLASLMIPQIAIWAHPTSAQEAVTAADDGGRAEPHGGALASAAGAAGRPGASSATGWRWPFLQYGQRRGSAARGRSVSALPPAAAAGSGDSLAGSAVSVGAVGCGGAPTSSRQRSRLLCCQ